MSKLGPVVKTYHACKLLHAEQEKMLRVNKYSKRDRRLLKRCQRDLAKTTRDLENIEIEDLCQL